MYNSSQFARVEMVKKSKSDVVDFTVDHSAASLAESWLDGMIKDDVGHEKDAEVTENIKKPRPARMGLGASFVPHSKLHTGKAVSECLAKVKRKSAPDVIFRTKALADSDDEHESRTKSIKKSKSSDAPIKKQLSDTPIKEPSSAMEGGHNLNKKIKKKNIKSREVDVGPDSVPSVTIHESTETDTVNTTNISAARLEELARRPPRRRRIKGKKTRSRQKNLRKDNRPEHLKPGFQPPPTD